MGVPIRGQDVIVIVTENGEIKEIPVKSVEISGRNEIQVDGYLGENFDRRTSIHSGYTGRLTGHMETAKTFQLRDAIDRAARGEKIIFSLVASFSFPDGTRSREQYTGLVFGEHNITADDRKNKIPLNLPFEAEKKKTLANF